MKKIDVIFDTDVYNEVDDQFAISYMLANDDLFNVKAITIAPYNVEHQPISVKEGNDLSFAETHKILKLMGKNVPVYNGSLGFMTNGYSKLSDGVRAIIDICRKNKFTYIAAVGPITNIALALKNAPDIADKIRVIWLGTGHILNMELLDTNFIADPKAFKYVLDNCPDFTIVSTVMSKCMRTSIYEMQAKFGSTPLEQYLIARTKWFYYYDVNGESITLHDVLPLDILINPKQYDITQIQRPVLKDYKCFDFSKPNKFKTLKYVTYIDHYRAMTNFYKGIKKFTDKK